MYFLYTAFTYPILCVALVYTLWVFYLAVMALDRAKEAGTLRPIAFKLGLPILGIGYFLDLLTNVFVMTFVMLELPREWVVTARLRRHVKDSDGCRKTVS